jgi:hypothetical protein
MMSLRTNNCRQCLKSCATTADSRDLSANPEVRSDSETAGDGENEDAEDSPTPESHCLSIVYYLPTRRSEKTPIKQRDSHLFKARLSTVIKESLMTLPQFPLLTRTIHQYRIFSVYDFDCTDTCTDIL